MAGNVDSSSSKPDAVTHADIVPLVWLSCGLAGLAGLLFGMDIGVISGALPLIKQEFHITSGIEGWIVSSMMVGATIGALAAGSISKRLGRKRALLLAAILFIIGAVVAASSFNISQIVAGRAILGLAVGVASFTAPLYLSEVTPERIRGATISFYQLMVTVGILAAFISNLLFSYIDSWRWMFGVLSIPAVLLFLGALSIPKSPRWLAGHDQFDQARHVLSQLRSTKEEVDYEINEIQENLQQEDQTRGWAMLRTNVNFRRSVALGIILQLIQQFTGMNVIMYFAPRIFEMAGFQGTEATLWATVVTGLTNLLATFIAIAFIDRLGRKPILYIGFALMAAMMASLAGIFYIGPSSLTMQYIALGAVLLFVTGFAMSAGPLIWTLCSEIQPLNGRDFGISASTGANWIGNFLLGQFFPIMLAGLGGPWTFGLLALVNALFIIFTLMFVPETKGVSLENIEKNLMSGKPLRKLGI